MHGLARSRGHEAFFKVAVFLPAVGAAVRPAALIVPLIEQPEILLGAIGSVVAAVESGLEIPVRFPLIRNAINLIKERDQPLNFCSGFLSKSPKCVGLST